MSDSREEFDAIDDGYSSSSSSVASVSATSGLSWVAIGDLDRPGVGQQPALRPQTSFNDDEVIAHLSLDDDGVSNMDSHSVEDGASSRTISPDPALPSPLLAREFQPNAPLRTSITFQVHGFAFNDVEWPFKALGDCLKLVNVTEGLLLEQLESEGTDASSHVNKSFLCSIMTLCHDVSQSVGIIRNLFQNYLAWLSRDDISLCERRVCAPYIPAVVLRDIRCLLAALKDVRSALDLNKHKLTWHRHRLVGSRGKSRILKDRFRRLRSAFIRLDSRLPSPDANRNLDEINSSDPLVSSDITYGLLQWQFRCRMFRSFTARTSRLPWGDHAYGKTLLGQIRLLDHLLAGAERLFLKLRKGGHIATVEAVSVPPEPLNHADGERYIETLRVTNLALRRWAQEESHEGTRSGLTQELEQNLTIMTGEICYQLAQNLDVLTGLGIVTKAVSEDFGSNIDHAMECGDRLMRYCRDGMLDNLLQTLEWAAEMDGMPIGSRPSRYTIYGVLSRRYSLTMNFQYARR